MVQQYVNIEDQALETVFLFPCDIDSVITKLTCEFTLPDGTKTMLETKVEERTKAEVKYEDAVTSGKTAVFSTYTRAHRDMIRINIGNFPPLSEAVIKVSYC